VDVGGLADDAGKARVILEAMKLMGYQATGIGAADLRLKDKFFELARQSGVPVIASLGDYRDRHPEVLDRLILTVGRRKVGFAAVPKPSGGRIRATPLIAVLKDLRRRCDLVVVLSQLGTPDDRRLVALPGMRGLADVLIGNSQAVKIAGTEEDEGVTLVSNKGKGCCLHVVEVRFRWLRRPAYKCLRFVIQPQLPKDPAVEKLVREHSKSVQDEFLRFSSQSMPARAAWGWVDSQACGRCHPAQYKQWADSRHAHAVATLARAHRLAPECLPCHSETYRQIKMWQPSGNEREGVECVTCHGNGDAHMKTPQRWNIDRGEGSRVCVNCHTTAHSPSFQYDVYREMIQHW